jgi:hypothetical protein
MASKARYRGVTSLDRALHRRVRRAQKAAENARSNLLKAMEDAARVRLPGPAL